MSTYSQLVIFISDLVYEDAEVLYVGESTVRLSKTENY